MAKSSKAEAKAEPKAKARKKAEVVAETVTSEQAPEKKIEIEKPTETTTAKAGKRSAKAQAEVQEKTAKAERKAELSPADAKPVKKASQQPPKSRLERSGKNYREAAKLVDQSKIYSLAEALELAAKTSPTKFDSSVELHINLGIDPKVSDQNVRGSVALPAGTGKKIRIAVFADKAQAAAANKSGADIAGEDEIIAKLDKQELDFDVIITAPQQMPKLAKYAKLLGPRGLMPNPKSGTVTTDISKAIAEIKAGRVEYRTDSNGIVHAAIGKVSFKPSDLLLNAEALMTSIRAAKPASVKGAYVKNIYVSSTMGPSVQASLGR